MKNTISASKFGSRINLMINGSLQSKDFGSENNAKIVFTEILKLKNHGDDAAVNQILGLLNKNVRIARTAGFEYDVDSGVTYMEGFNTPVPEDFMEVFEEYVENGYPVESLQNFWTLLMGNPDERIREDAFKFIRQHDFSITDKGYMVVYKTVDYLRKMDNDLISFVTNTAVKVKDRWKKPLNKFLVYKDITRTMETHEEYYSEADEYGMTDEEFYDEYGCEPEEYTEDVEHEVVTFEYKFTEVDVFNKWIDDEDFQKEVEFVGKLDELQDTIFEIEKENVTVFTDKYTHKTEIRLGEPVKMDRTKCDGDPKNECSYGLHVGSTKYVEQFRGFGAYNSQDKDVSPVLICLINPMNIVAIPEYDNSKMRVTEYYPFALGTVDNDNKIEIIKQKYYENDYVSHEEETLKEMLSAQSDNVRPTAIDAEADTRSLDEYMKILEKRVVNLTD